MYRRLLSILCSLSILSFLSPLVVYAQETKNMAATATIPAKPNDYQLSITADPRDSRQSQGADIHYVITYGSDLDYGTAPFIIQATLLPGRIQGFPVPSLYIADIVQGSPSNGYMMTTPVINLASHTITWTIPTLPAKTNNQTVSFTLRTNTAYTGTDVVDFDVQVKAIAPDITLNALLTESYVYKAPPPIITPSPTPTPAPPHPTITSVTMNEITNSTATFTLTTDTPTTISAIATAKNKILTQTLNDPRISRWHQITISNLVANMSYTIKFTLTGTNGQTTTSNALLIHTTLEHTPLNIDPSSVVLTSLDTIFRPDIGSQNALGSPLVTLPTNTAYTFQVRIPDAKRITRIQGIIRDSHVLGMSIGSVIDSVIAKEPESSTDMIDMAELSPSVFTGTMKTKPASGLYDLRIRITDENENVTEHLLGTLSVVNPFTVIHEDSGEPIEHARIFLSRYFPKDGTYIPLSPTFVSTRNPVFTAANGQATFVLPEGIYKATVTYLGTEKTVLFEIDNNKHIGFPVVSLTPVPYTTSGFIKYYLQTLLDIMVNIAVSNAAAIGSSRWLFGAISSFVMILLICMTVLAFSSRTLVPITAIPSYLLHTIRITFFRSIDSKFIRGIVIDGSNKTPIAKANVFIINSSTNTIATILHTDKFGRYFFHAMPNTTYAVEVRRIGYEVTEPVIYQPDVSPTEFTHVLHTHAQHALHKALTLLKQSISTLVGAFFETFIVLSCVLELLYMRYFGLSATLPYIIASCLTIILWISYMHHTHVLSTD